uniref:IBA57 homolog, iron-sulfur cluster assembly n=2 Tax=Gallus gallus TaxID=9031 RepID=A0A8V1A585_CHICK
EQRRDGFSPSAPLRPQLQCCAGLKAWRIKTKASSFFSIFTFFSFPLATPTSSRPTPGARTLRAVLRGAQPGRRGVARQRRACPPSAPPSREVAPTHTRWRQTRQEPTGPPDSQPPCWLHESQEEEPHILLECDSSVLDAIQKHLKLYKIRRKVSISPCLDLSLWAVVPGEQAGDISRYADRALVLTPDPRAEVMGWRLIIKAGANLPEIIPGSRIENVQDYHRHRYKQGIPEGVKDLPPGVALPLESNLAYMNGVSFTKGCYIGQELTARTHHMGVIRKRLVPVQFSVPLPQESIPEGAEILTESGKAAGKFRAGGDELGIALLRLANVNEPLCLNVAGDKVKLTASIPEWWPKTASK